MQQFIQYNQELGVKAGGGESITDGGAYIFNISSALYDKAGTGTHGIDLSVVSDQGLKARFIKIYYAKADNTAITGGQSMLNAFMGLLKIDALSFTAKTLDGAQVNCVPELEGKTIGLFLQKKLFIKKDGSEGYSFEIKAPFDPATGKTLREIVENKEPKTIERLTNSYADKDERKAVSSSAPQQSSGSMYPDEI